MSIHDQRGHVQPHTSILHILEVSGYMRYIYLDVRDFSATPFPQDHEGGLLLEVCI